MGLVFWINSGNQFQAFLHRRRNLTMVNSKLFIMVLLSLALFYGCTSQGVQKSPPVVTSPIQKETSVQSPPPTVPSNSVTPPKNTLTSVQQDYQIVKLRVDSNTPGSRAYGTSFYNTVYLDLVDNSYVHSISDGSQSLIYYNGIYYKATVLSGQCFVSSIKEDLTTNLNRNELSDLGFFLFVEKTLKPQAGNKFDITSDTYTLKIDGTSDSVFKKYGGLYLGSNVKMMDSSSGLSTYAYSSLQPLSKSEYITALNQEISKWQSCKSASGGSNPLPSQVS